MTDLAICDALIASYAWKGEPGWWDQGDLGQGDHGIAWAAKRGDDGVTDIYLRGSVTPLDWFRDFFGDGFTSRSATLRWAASMRDSTSACPRFGPR